MTKLILKGLIFGASAGLAAYAIETATRKQKKRLKRSTGKAVRACGSIFENFTDIL